MTRYNRVVAADYSEESDPDLYGNLLIAHIKMLLSHRAFRNCRVVVIPENNLAFEAAHLSREVKRVFDPHDVICLNADINKAGVRTDNLMKRALAKGLQKLLDAEAIHFWTDFMSFEATTKNAAELSRRLAEDEMRDYIIKETQGFLRVTRPQRDVTKPPLIQYTGKLYGGYDDMLIALMLGNVGRKIFFDLEEYKNYH